MRKVVTIIAAVLALAMLTASVAIAGNGRGVEKQSIVQVFDDGTMNAFPFPDDGDITGTVKLIRRATGLKATAKVSGLEVGGVYTFWLIVGESGYVLPNAFAALGGSKVVGKNGKATVRITAEVGETGVEGYLTALLGSEQGPDTLPFHDTFDLDPLLDEVHVEIAYHGQAEDAGANIDQWRSDFWTGTACPAGALNYNPVGTPVAPGATNLNGQEHCEVSYVAIFPAP